MSQNDVRCLPLGICSWTFELRGRGRGALVELGFTDRGRIQLDDERELTVTRASLFGRTWWLGEGGETRATAEKLALRRSFELGTPDGDELGLRAESFLARTYRLTRGRKDVATIRPDHLFTRRATIEVARELDFELLCFAFWLAAMSWRRTQRSH